MTCVYCDGFGQKQNVLAIWKQCPVCDGSGTVTIDPDAIRRAITTRTGLAKSKPAAARSVFGAEYVWRMIRFHAGVDVTMPTTCWYTIGCGGILQQRHQSLLNVLDRLVDDLAEEFFGTSTAAAEVWVR